MESGTTGPPDPCQKAADAVGLIRNELWLFIENWCWRIDRRGIQPNFPMKIKNFWRNAPENMDTVISPGHGDTYFFKGDKFWRVKDNRDMSSPMPLTALGFPSHVRRIDAAFVWSHNEKAYFFTGETYWRFDASTDDLKLDEYYPRFISEVWLGVPNDLDNAFTDLYGKTHFVKNFRDYLFHDSYMTVKENAIANFGSYWFNCTKKIEYKHDDFDLTANDSNRTKMSFLSTVFLFIIFTRFFL